MKSPPEQIMNVVTWVLPSGVSATRSTYRSMSALWTGPPPNQWFRSASLPSLLWISRWREGCACGDDVQPGRISARRPHNASNSGMAGVLFIVEAFNPRLHQLDHRGQSGNGENKDTKTFGIKIRAGPVGSALNMSYPSLTRQRGKDSVRRDRCSESRYPESATSYPLPNR